MKTLKLVTTILLALTVWVSCSDGNDPVVPEKPDVPETPQGPSISVPAGAEDFFAKGMTFDSNVGEKSFTFQTDADWTISVDSTRNGVNWCSVSPMSGKAGKHTVSVKAEANTTYDERKASLTLAASSIKKSFVITQNQQDALIVGQKEFEVGAKGGTIGVKLSSNVHYDIQIDCDWISRVSSRGLTNDSLTFNIQPNVLKTERKGAIKIVCEKKNISESISVKQLKLSPYTKLETGKYIGWRLGSETTKIIFKPQTKAENLDCPISTPDSDIPAYMTWKDNVITISTEADEFLFNENCAGMFATNHHLKEICFDHCNTSKVTNMAGMFQYNPLLVDLDVSFFDTSHVTNMVRMFGDCGSLKNLNIDGFDTHNVTDMQYMFCGCSSLINVDLTNLDTGKVTNMDNMFAHCESLLVDVSSFNTGNVRNMASMFIDCRQIVNLDLSHFDTSKVTDMSSMFALCFKLKNLNISHFDTSNVTNMLMMFCGCYSLDKLTLSHFETSKVTKMSNMFALCVSIKDLELSNFNTANVDEMWCMFSGCSKLKNLDLSHFDTRKVLRMEEMFSGCENLNSLDLGKSFIINENTKITDMCIRFSCHTLKCTQSTKDRLVLPETGLSKYAVENWVIYK